MQSLFIAINAYLRENKIRSIGFILALFFVLFYFSTKISFQENITELIPSNNNSDVTSKVLKQVNFADKITVIIERKPSVSSDELTSYANQFIDSLEVNCKQDCSKIQGKIDENNIQETFDFVYQNLPLFLNEEDYKVLQSKINKDSIASITETNYKSLIAPTGIVSKDFILKDPLGISFIALKKLQQLSVGNDFSIENGFVLTKDKNKLLLFITPKLPANETDKNTIFIDKLNRIKNNINSKFSSKVSISYFGATPIAVANASQIKADVRNTSIFASLCLILLLAYFYRSIFTPIIIFIPSIFGAVFALSILYFTKGTISAISLGISSILLGETTDYSIYVLTHLRNNKDLKLLYKDISKPLLLCGATTAITFLCLFFIKSEALNDLGFFAALSVTSTTIFSLVLIPLLYNLKNTSTDIKPNIIDQIGSYSFHKNRILLVSIIVIIFISFFTFSKVTFDNNLASLNYVPSEIQKAQDDLEKVTSGDSKSIYLASYGASYDEVLSNNILVFNQLQKKKKLDNRYSFSSIGGIVLSKEEQQNKIEQWNTFWSSQKKNQVQSNLISNGAKFGFNPNAFQQFYSTLNTEFKPIDFTEFAEIKALFVDEFVSVKNNFYTVSTLVKVPKEQRDEFVKQMKLLPNLVVIDRQETNETFLGTLKTNFESLVNYSFIAVFLILLVYFRRIELVIVSIIPVVLSWIFTMGVMGMFGLQFNFINIIVCTLIFGIGVDYSIFMTTALQKQHTFGKLELSTYRTSILLSVATTILGIGVLIFAQHPALKSIALIAIIGIIAAALLTFVIQPLVFDFFVTNNVKKGNPPFEIRRFFHSIFSFTYYGLGGFLLSIIGAVFIKFFPMSKKRKLQIFHFVMSKFMHSVFLTYPAINRKIINKGNEKFEKPSIIIANHSSFLDILAVGMLSPKIVFLVSDWVYNSPFFGRGVRLAGFYPVSNGIDNGIEHLREKVNQGFSLMVFPEGTRSVDNSVKRFHKGAFYLADQFNLDIVPIVIHGYSESSPKGDFMLYKSSTTVEILPRIAPNDDSFGENYTEKAKKINSFFRTKYDELRTKEEDENYFKKVLFNSFDYKEPEVINSVKKDFIKNSQVYFNLNKYISSKAKILHLADDYGQLDVLLSLQNSLRKIDSFISNVNKRECAKTNYFLKKRTINYIDDLSRIDCSKYDIILISDFYVNLEINTFTGTVILFSNKEKKNELIEKGFNVLEETNSFSILKK